MDLQGKETLVCFYMTILGKKKSSNCVVLNFQLSLKERRKKNKQKTVANIRKIYISAMA